MHGLECSEMQWSVGGCTATSSCVLEPTVVTIAVAKVTSPHMNGAIKDELQLYYIKVMGAVMRKVKASQTRQACHEHEYRN